jgi:hypothetical protein
VYDDGDTETVRLEADASKRRPDDVSFRWLPDDPAPLAAPAVMDVCGAPAEEVPMRSPGRSPSRGIGSPAAARSPPSARGLGVASPRRTPARGTASPAARPLASPPAEA